MVAQVVGVYVHVGGWRRRKSEGGLPGGYKETFGSNGYIFVIWILVKGSRYLDCGDGLMVCIYIKTYQIVYFIKCQLYLKKAIWKKSRNKDAKQYHILFIYAADKCSVVSNSLQPHGL